MHAEQQTDEKPLRLVDFNNFFSFKGGGIRTYHLRKLEFMAARSDVEYALLVPSDAYRIEEHGGARLYHLRSMALPGGASNYRLFVNPFALRRILRELEPDLIEVGGSYLDPWLVRYAARGLSAVVAGFWHANYPDTYFARFGEGVTPQLGGLLRAIGWGYARATYGRYDATFAAAGWGVDRLLEHGIERVVECPLGVDTEQFHPRHRDAALRERVGAGERPLVFFPHRLREEKGIREFLKAIPGIAEATGAVFAIAGTGPEYPLVERAIAGRADCRYVGFIDSREEMARWYASSDLVSCLGAWETFGLSVVEAMASGVPVLAAEESGCREWIARSGCGASVPLHDNEAVVAGAVRVLQSPKLREMGLQGRAYVEEHFSWGSTFERMLEYYRLLVDHRRQDQPLTGFPYRLEA